jgi:hypothetical protein
VKNTNICGANLSKIVLYGRTHVREIQGLPLNFVTAMAGVDGRIILNWIFKTWDWGGGMNWIDLAESRDRWLEPVNAAMNLRVQ